MNKLIQEAIERVDTVLCDSNHTGLCLSGEQPDLVKKFLKTELETIVKESFKNTETVGEDHKLEITKQGEIDTSKTHWATYGYRAALSDTKIKQNQFLNN